MLPSLALRPGSPAEIWALALLGLAGAAAGLTLRLAARPSQRQAALFAIYLCAVLGLSLVGHALVGSAPLVVSPYAATLVAGVIVAWALEAPRLRSIGLPPQLIFYALLGCLVLGVAGSRLASALSELPYGGSTDFGARLADRRAGLGVFGAFVTDTVFLVLLFRRFPEHSLARMLDGSASIIAFNVAVGRLGCLLAGCCFGAVTDPGPFAISVSAFQPDSPAGLAYHDTPDLAIWATQPLEAMAVLGLALGCEALYRARARLGLRDGTVIAAAAGGYGAIRALLEILRADSPRMIAGVLTVWQLLGLGLLAGAMGWVVVTRGRVKSLP